jgi:hypothetical protein
MDCGYEINLLTWNSFQSSTMEVPQRLGSKGQAKNFFDAYSATHSGLTVNE